jgi:uncharacterized membrane protein YhiD involved in acid resistance
VIELSTVAFRLGIALAFGAVIGVEREWRQKQAGLKTMSLVAIGAAAFALMSDTFGPGNHNPGQIAAAVVGGIGFLGAGVIMHRGLTVQGLTTAATLWADASVGVAAGLGQIPLAIALTVGIVTMQIIGRRAEVVIRRDRRRRAHGRFELRIDCEPEALHAANETWQAAKDLAPVRRSLQVEAALIIVRVILRAPASVDLTALEEKLVAIEGVKRVETRHLGTEED